MYLLRTEKNSYRSCDFKKNSSRRSEGISRSSSNGWSVRAVVAWPAAVVVVETQQHQ